LALNSHPVDIWTVPLDASRPLFLSSAEAERAARFRFEKDRTHWTRARSALREILSSYLSIAPENIEFSYGQNGKPATERIEFNLSHARNWALIAVSHGVPTGIDLELIREDVEIGNLLARIGEPETEGEHRELFHTWTRREARTKALGAQLMQVPPPEVCAVDIKAPEGFAASVALVWRTPVPRYCGGSL